MNMHAITSGATIFALLTLFGCTATGASAPASEPSFLVVGLTTDRALRDAFEDSATRALQSRGIRSATSYPLVPALDAGARERLVDAARTGSLTNILAVRVLGLREDGELADRSPIPVGDMGRLQAFYVPARLILADAPTPDQEVLVATAYNLDSGRIIWGGVSWVFDLDDPQATITEFSRMLADNVSAAIEIGPPR